MRGAILATVLAGLATAAHADVCASLNAQLSAMGGGGNMRQLEQQLRAAHQQAARAQCGGGSGMFLFGGNGRACAVIFNNIRRLQWQLGAAQRGGGGWSGGWAVNQRAQILGEMARSGCAPNGGGGNYGGYETVCARHCDGYYFQVGFRAKKADLKEQAALCTARYPEGQATLFFRRSGSDNAREFVGLDGARYSEQPYASRYLQEYDPSCPQPEKMLSPQELTDLQKVVDAATPRDAATGETGMPVPHHRPSPSEDPETVALRQGDLDATAKRPVQVAAAEPFGLRVVGSLGVFLLPASYGTPEEVVMVAAADPFLPAMVEPLTRDWAPPLALVAEASRATGGVQTLAALPAQAAAAAVLIVPATQDWSAPLAVREEPAPVPPAIVMLDVPDAPIALLSEVALRRSIEANGETGGTLLFITPPPTDPAPPAMPAPQGWIAPPPAGEEPAIGFAAASVVEGGVVPDEPAALPSESALIEIIASVEPEIASPAEIARAAPATQAWTRPLAIREEPAARHAEAALLGIGTPADTLRPDAPGAAAIPPVTTAQATRPWSTPLGTPGEPAATPSPAIAPPPNQAPAQSQDQSLNVIMAPEAPLPEPCPEGLVRLPDETCGEPQVIDPPPNGSPVEAPIPLAVEPPAPQVDPASPPADQLGTPCPEGQRKQQDGSCAA